MTYMDFEKEHIKDRPIEPYLENEDASDWANLTRYAEDNLQKAYNFGYDECYHEAKDIIKNCWYLFLIKMNIFNKYQMILD